MPDSAESAAKASFIFRGLPEVGDKSNTAVVRVDQAMQSPQGLSHHCDTAQHVLFDVDGTTSEDVSIDPFFFKITP